MKTKKLYVLIGPPAIGKSTWIADHLSAMDPFVVNRDAIIERVAHGMGWIYDDLFAAPPPTATVGETHPRYGEVVEDGSKLVYEQVLRANQEVHRQFTGRAYAANGRACIVFDLTHMNRRSRLSTLGFIQAPDEYRKIAVVFEFLGKENVVRASARRREIENGGEKTIGDEVFDKMFSLWMDVADNEGFDEIIRVDNIPFLEELLKTPAVPKS